MKEIKETNVIAIIVTYNRCNLLVRCVNSVIKQTYKCKSIIIVDNASTDNTMSAICSTFEHDTIEERDVLVHLSKKNEIDIHYIRKSKNEGGAGGFHMGMELASKFADYDALWMMDDDGYPSETCLEKLVNYLPAYDYVMPASIDIDNHINMSWPTKLKEGGKTLSYEMVKSSWGEIMEYIYPFNGSLLSKNLVEKVGYIDKRLFIWGDEYDHYWRCKLNGFTPVTVILARFFHPANKMSFIPILFGLVKVPYVDSKWKMVCLARNYTYIYRHYHQKYKIPIKFLIYTWLFLVSRKGDFGGWKLYMESVLDGFKEDFERHKKFLK